MTKQLYILIILTFQTTFTFACLNTYQFKIFPVGISQDKIVTIDVQIRRTSEYEGNKKLNLGLVNAKAGNYFWVLYSYISTYYKYQKLISLKPFDTTYSIGKSYSDTLDKTYHRGLEKIALQFNNLEYFKPDYISFCDFQQKCNLVKIQSDTVLNKEYVIYESKKYQTYVVQDSSYFGFDKSRNHTETIKGLYINSIRVYKTKTITMLIAHLATGHEISMGWITSDPKKASKKEDGEISLANEHKPNFKFSDINQSTYQEPLLHHGYGFDIFIIK